MAWVLAMRKDMMPPAGESGGFIAGDIVEVWADPIGGGVLDVGRVPLMDEGDGHPYGGIHTVIHVIGMSLNKAQMYIGSPADSTGIFYGAARDPNYNPDTPARAWKIDIDNKVPASKRKDLKGKKPKKFKDKYDVDGKKPKAGGFDLEVTVAEFDTWMTLKPVTQSPAIP